MDTDRLTAKYIELRDRRAALKKQYEDTDHQLVRLMEGIEGALKQEMHRINARSVNTNHGTVYIGYQESARVADWDSLLDHIQTTERWDLLERRVSKSVVKELMTETRDGGYVNPPPPGVDFTRIEKVFIRRKS